MDVERMLVFFLMVQAVFSKTCPYAFVPQRIWGKGLTLCCRYAYCDKGFYLKKCTVDMGRDRCVQCPVCTYQDERNDSYYPETCKRRRCYPWEISTTATSTATRSLTRGLTKSTSGRMSTLLMDITKYSITSTIHFREERFTPLRMPDSKTSLPTSTDSYPDLTTADYQLDSDIQLSTVDNKRHIGWYTSGRKRRRFSKTPSITPTSTSQSVENSGNNYYIEVCNIECKLSRYSLIGLGILVVVLIGISGYLIYLHKRKSRSELLNVTCRQNSETGFSDAYQDIHGYTQSAASLPNSPTYYGRASYLHPYLTINTDRLQENLHCYDSLQTRI